MAGGFSEASATIAAAAPATGPTGAALGGSRPLPEGTSATVLGSLIAGGDLHIRAKDDLKVEGLVGTVAGGVVGVGAAVLVLNVESQVEAYVAPVALSAGSGSDDELTVEAITTEKSHGIAFGGGVGGVTVGGQVVVLTTHASQRAEIDSGATIAQAGGGVSVIASGIRDLKVLAIGGAVSGVAVGVAIAVVNASGDTIAMIGNVPVGSEVTGGGPVGGLTVSPTSHASPRAEAYSVQAGVGGGLSGPVAITNLSGLTRAASAAHGPLGGLGFHVLAT